MELSWFMLRHCNDGPEIGVLNVSLTTCRRLTFMQDQWELYMHACIPSTQLKKEKDESFLHEDNISLNSLWNNFGVIFKISLWYFR